MSEDVKLFLAQLDEAITLKYCSGCEDVKQLSEFNKGTGIHGVKKLCRVCTRIAAQGVCQDCNGPTAKKATIRCNDCKKMALVGENSPFWRGGRQERNGYVELNMPSHPNANNSGRVFEHTVVMSKHLGRPLAKGENVHHKNGVRNDNRIENLELWSTSQPYGQRIEDKVEWAIEILKQYRPEVLRDE